MRRKYIHCCGHLQDVPRGANPVLHRNFIVLNAITTSWNPRLATKPISGAFCIFSGNVETLHFALFLSTFLRSLWVRFLTTVRSEVISSEWWKAFEDIASLRWLFVCWTCFGQRRRIEKCSSACWEDGLVTSYQFTLRPLFVPLLLVWSQECFCGSFRRGSMLQSSCSVHGTARLLVRLGAIPAFVNLFPERQKTGFPCRARAAASRPKKQFLRSKKCVVPLYGFAFDNLLFFVIFFLLAM